MVMAMVVAMMMKHAVCQTSDLRNETLIQSRKHRGSTDCTGSNSCCRCRHLRANLTVQVEHDLTMFYLRN